MEAQLYNTTKNVPDYTDCATTLNICQPENVGRRWIVLAVMCKRMQQLQTGVELRVHHGMDTTHKTVRLQNSTAIQTTSSLSFFQSERNARDKKMTTRVAEGELKAHVRPSLINLKKKRDCWQSNSWHLILNDVQGDQAQPQQRIRQYRCTLQRSRNKKNIVGSC